MVDMVSTVPTVGTQMHHSRRTTQARGWHPVGRFGRHRPVFAPTWRGLAAESGGMRRSGSRIGEEIDGMARWPSARSVGGVLRASDYVGTAVFAVSGSVTAGVAGMDVLGATVVGTITAIGGGTIRDAIILHKRPFWVEEAEYFMLAVAAAFGAFALWPGVPDGNILKDGDGGEGPALWWGDALGVGAFACIGAQNAIRCSTHPLVAIACGMVTATFGGLTRDVLCGLPSSKRGHGRILHSASDIYATTALGGATTYVLARQLGLPVALRITTGVAASILLRFVASSNSIGLPTWQKPSFNVDASDEK